MLLVIHNLPSNTRYTDVKALIKEKCGLTEMIVDNLVAEGVNKKVTVGLADEGDAALLTRKINGLYVCNQQLYVEDVRQKKTNDQPYRPPTTSQFEQQQFNQSSQNQYQAQYFGQSGAMSFQPPPLMSMESQLSDQLAPNFGVPFYMTAQKQNLGNKLQFMVQYPKVQGSLGNETLDARDVGFAEQYGGGKLDQPMSFDRSQQSESSPRRSSRWNEPDCDKSDGRRGRDRSSQRNSDRDDDQSYKDNSYQDSFQSRSNQDYGSNRRNNKKFEKPFFNRSDYKWVRPNSSTFGEQHEPFSFNDNKNHDRHYDQERESQRHRENSYSQLRDFDYASRSSEFSKKRPYDSSDKNQFGPQSKKFGSNQEFNIKNQQGASGSQFSNNYQGKKNPYLNKSPVRGPMQQNRPQVQPRGSYFQLNRPQMQPKVPHFQPNRFQMPPKGLQKNKPQFQQKNTKKPMNISKVRPDFKKPVEEGSPKFEAWRVQAAAVIATQIFNNMGRSCNKRDPVLIKLKACVRARMDVIIGNDMTMTLKDMLSNYRVKFQDDDAFYKTVKEKVENAEEDELETPKKETEKNIDIKPTGQFFGKAPPTVPNTDNPQRLPKYPAGDKKMLSQMKKAQKDEMMNESLYNLDAEHEKALNDELDKFDKLAKQQLVNPQSDSEKSISDFMKDVFVPDMRKVLALHVKKRILDIRTNLSVRVICQYKAPKRNALDLFLKDFGVLSLKASDKNRNVLVAICDSYENYDALCMQESAVIDNLKISFKPLHITGPPVKTRTKKQAPAARKPIKLESNSGYDDDAVAIDTQSGNDDDAVAIETQSGNDDDAVAIETKSGNDDGVDAIENESVNDDAEISGGSDGPKNDSEVQKSQANENSDCVIVPSDKSKDVTVIEEKQVKSNEEVVDKVQSEEKIEQDNMSMMT